MKELFYEEWANNRYEKIIKILGKKWFKGKKVAELACAHGDIGKKLMQCGADVHFSDINQVFLYKIGEEIYSLYNREANLFSLDQNKPYTLDNFDLVLHFGVLYHLENWKQDLECALQSTNLMFLETVVLPLNSNYDEFNHTVNDAIVEYDHNNIYGTQTGTIPVLTQKRVEQHLDKLGCKYICVKDQDLDTEWCTTHAGGFIRHLYSWDENFEHPLDGTHYRRFWIIMK